MLLLGDQMVHLGCIIFVPLPSFRRVYVFLVIFIGSPAVARLASGSLNSSVLPQLQCVLLAGAGLKMLPDAITSASHLL